MTNERVYDADEGEFVDFATLDDWQERDQLKSREIERLRYVLEGVRGAIDTGRNEPLMVWRDQINIALGDATDG
ncbi:MAG: hypothetical protein MJH10_10130 [Epibacterium sp.]|nr:hypothetical protein [Epibacterium sp.]NQX73895.1 hypothetical protein [Epibacterium sp.]